MSRDDFLAQEETARILLEAMSDAGFVLAGSSAIRMHGLIDRPTRDIDLFAPGILSQEDFDTAVDTGFQALENHGWSVDVRQRSGKFVQFIAMKGDLRAEGDIGVSVPKCVEKVEPPVSPVYSSPLYPRDGGYVSPVDVSYSGDVGLSRDM